MKRANSKIVLYEEMLNDKALKISDKFSRIDEFDMENRKKERRIIKIKVIIDYLNGLNKIVIANKYNLSTKTVSRYINRYEIEGDNFLQANKKTTYIMDENTYKDIIETLKDNPITLGLPYSIWDIDLIKMYIKKKYNKEVSNSYCSRLLKESDSYYKNNTYDAEKSSKLESDINNLITNLSKCNNVWYLENIFLGNIDRKINPFDKRKSATKVTVKRFVLTAINKELIFYLVTDKINKKNIDELLKEIIEHSSLGENTYLVIANDKRYKGLLKEYCLNSAHGCVNNIKVIFKPKGINLRSDAKDINKRLTDNKEKILKYNIETLENLIEKLLNDEKWT